MFAVVSYLTKEMTTAPYVEQTLPLDCYKAHGYDNREDYLNSLKEEYGEELVDALTSCLPASEDFDGLVTELEDNYYGW